MISKLSKGITEALYNASVIEETDKELYVYGFFVMLSQVLFFLLSTLFGLLLRTLWESIVFYIMFSTIRCYAGGFHASKESVCTCCTTVALFLASLGLYFLKREECVTVSCCVLTFSSIVVYLLSPLDSEDKPLSFHEFLDYRRKSRLISVGIVAVAIIGCFFHSYGILYAASASMLLESCLLILGRVSRWIREAHDY